MSGKRKREESPDPESSSKDNRKKKVVFGKKTDLIIAFLKKSQPSQPLDDETVKKMKALVDYIVEYEDR